MDLTAQYPITSTVPHKRLGVAEYMVNKQPTGYVVFQGASKLDGAPIVAVLTVKSKNEKTANMAQLWIMRSDVGPVEAMKTGASFSICGDCQHDGARESDGTLIPKTRTCYVKTFQAPRSIFEAYRRGRYPVVTPRRAASIVAGRPVRLGAYGDPAALPAHILRSVTARAPKRTGYTHQWRRNAHLQNLIMASVDTEAQARDAQAAGWRYFRVSANGALLPGEIVCPASKEAGYRTTCERCGLCNGSTGPDDRRKNIAILAHGAMAVRFIRNASELAH